MADRTRSSAPALRRARETALAICTLWLVVQNCVLLAFVPWKRLPDAASIVAAVLKAAVLVLGPLWILGSAALLGWAFMTWMAREPQPAAATEWEIDHGRAR